MSEFKYLEYILDESGIDETECSRKVEGANILHESLLMPVLM